jgi:hypothetical protein
LFALPVIEETGVNDGMSTVLLMILIAERH